MRFIKKSALFFFCFLILDSFVYAQSNNAKGFCEEYTYIADLLLKGEVNTIASYPLTNSQGSIVYVTSARVERFSNEKLYKDYYAEEYRFEARFHYTTSNVTIKFRDMMIQQIAALLEGCLGAYHHTKSETGQQYEFLYKNRAIISLSNDESTDIKLTIAAPMKIDLSSPAAIQSAISDKISLSGRVEIQNGATVTLTNGPRTSDCIFSLIMMFSPMHKLEGQDVASEMLKIDMASVISVKSVKTNGRHRALELTGNNKYTISQTAFTPSTDYIGGRFDQSTIIPLVDESFIPLFEAWMKACKGNTTSSLAPAESEKTDDSPSRANLYEIKGASSTILNDNASTGIDDVRFTITSSGKFRLSISPLGMSWINLPRLQKINNQGIVTGFEHLNPNFFSPSIGFAYSFISKKDRDDAYRMLEFPLSFNFGALFSPKDKHFEKGNSGDSDVKDYFRKFNYYIQGSFGANLFFADNIGVAASIGAYYIDVRESANELSFSQGGTTTKFKVKMESMRSIVPAADVKLIFRL